MQAPAENRAHGVADRLIVTGDEWRPAADAVDDALAAADPPLTAQARQRLIVYAKGDVAWASKLLETAADISRDQGWPEIPLAAVRAGLLQCWMREHRLPERLSPAGGAAHPGLSDGPMAGPLIAEEGARLTEAGTAEVGEAALVVDGRRDRSLSAGEDQPSRHDARAHEGTEDGRRGLAAATLRGERFSYLAALGIATLSVVAALFWFHRDDDGSSTGALPPSSVAVVAPLSPPEATVPPAFPEPAPPQPTPLPAVADLPTAPPPQAEAVVTPGPSSPQDGTVVAPTPPPPPVTARPGARPAAHPPQAVATPDVRSVQNLLIVLGYRPGAADGRMGPRTAAAIQAFQRDVGAQPDGTVSPHLLRQLLTRLAASGSSLPAAAPLPPAADSAPRGNPTLQTIGRLTGTSFNSAKNRAAVVAHCRAVPDDRIYDESVGAVVPCSRFVDVSPTFSADRERP